MKTFKDYIKGFRIVSCAAKSNREFCFVLAAKSRSKLIFIDLNAAPEKRITQKALSDLSQPHIAFNHQPNAEFCVIDLRGQVYAGNANQMQLEAPHSTALKGRDFLSVVLNVVHISGDLYSLGSSRRFYKRLSANNWQDLSADLAIPKADVASMWQDADGFNAQDMYIVGSYGEVWHFDGEHFIKLKFPSDNIIESVCCAGDGNVYIAGQEGLWVGKQHTWQQVPGGYGAITPDTKGLVWFNGQLWHSNGCGLKVLKNGEMQSVYDDVPDDVRTCLGGNLDVTPDGKYMLTASRDGAALYDGKQWQKIMSFYD